MKQAVPFLCLAMLVSGQLVTRAQDATTQPAGTPAATTQQPTQKSMEEIIQDLQNRVNALQDAISSPKGTVQTTAADVKKIKKVSIGGYVQVRYNIPQDNVAGNNDKNTFDIKRARVKFSANPTANTNATVTFDAAPGTSSSVKECYIAYTIGNGDAKANASATAGQFLVPFGFMVNQSSAVRETPEEPLVTQKLFPGDFDRGAKISTPSSNRLFAEVGVVNGVGIGQTKNGTTTFVDDDNATKNLVGRVRYHATKNLDLGGSYYVGREETTAFNGTQTNQDRLGGDAQLYLGRTKIEGEYICAQDDNATEWGWYTQVTHNVTKKDTLVAMYDVYKSNDKVITTDSQYGQETAWNLGMIHALDSATRLKFFYQINDEQTKKYKNNPATVELITVF